MYFIKKIKFFLPAIILLIIIIAALLTKNNKIKNSETSLLTPTARIQNFPIEQYDNIITLSGKSRPDTNVEIKTLTSGQIIQIMAAKNDKVEKDIIIAEIGNNNLESIAKKAAASLEQKQLEYSTMQKLFTQNNSSKLEYLNAKAALDIALSDIEIANIALSHNKIVAPFDGQLSNIYIKTGDFVSNGQTIGNIINNKTIFYGYASEQEVQKIKTGMIANVTVKQHDQNINIIECKINFIEPIATKNTQSFLVETQCEDTEQTNIFGISGNIKIKTDTINALRIPSSAVFLNTNNKPSIKIAENNIVKTITIKIISQDSKGNILIESPSQEQVIQVITYGQSYIKDNEKITSAINT